MWSGCSRDLETNASKKKRKRTRDAMVVDGTTIFVGAAGVEMAAFGGEATHDCAFKAMLRVSPPKETHHHLACFDALLQ